MPQARSIAGLALLALLSPSAARAAEAVETVVLTLPEALELAARRSFALRAAGLDREDAQQQVRLAYADVLPQLRGSASYTRIVEAADPFAGSDAGASFAALDAVSWLRFNEAARTDEDPATEPLAFDAFRARQAAALEAAGASFSSGGNPFLVENAFTLGLSLTQVLYDGRAFSALDGAEAFAQAAEEARAAERLAVVQAVSRAFYGALLQRAQLGVLEESVARAEANLADARARVEAGVLPELQRLTAEVELANRRTETLRARTILADRLDQLRVQVALPENQPVEIRGELELEPHLVPTPEEALPEALGRRPDLARARSLVRVQEVAEAAASGALLPRILLDADLSANGRVPDDRSRVVAAPTADDPFRLQQDERGLFDDAYWFPVFTVGVRLEWALFDGFGNYARIERARIAARRARIAVEQAELSVRIEVERSLRDLAITLEQVETQQHVRELAQRNYAQTEAELGAGAVTQFDLRQASQQLDESRFNHLQAIHDHAVAWVDYQVAIGAPPVPGEKNP